MRNSSSHRSRHRRTWILPTAAAALVLGSALVTACDDGSNLPTGRWQTSPTAGGSGAATGGSGGSSGAGASSSPGAVGPSGSSSGGGTAGGSGGESGSGAASGGSSGSSSGSPAAGASSGSSGSGGSSGSSGSGGPSDGGSSGTTPPATPKFDVSVDQTSLKMQLLATSTVHVSVAPNGYSGSVQLQIGSVSGVTATFQPATLDLDGTTAGTSTLTLATVDSSPPGTVAVDVQATADGATVHQSVSVDVQSIITIHIPAGVNGLGGTVTKPVTDAYGPYPFKIVAPASMSAQSPVTVYFMNDDDVSHEIHADNPDQGFGHDPGPFAAHTMDSFVRNVNTPGAYDFYLHDQGAPITVGLVEIK